jgi:outer membrane lipoprotein-sorting protein
MRAVRWCLLASLLVLPGVADALSVDEILKAVDKNLTFETRESTLVMTVTKNGRAKTYKMHSYAKGADTAAIEYLEPERDKGTKMLRIGQELWMYMPSVEKTQKISGHMLRQSMMGSDMSYEDMMESSAWMDKYSGVVDGTEIIEGRSCYKLTLTAKSPETTYAKRVVWVDQQTSIPLRQDLYAVSGMLVKSWTMGSVQTIEGRQWPTRMVIEDKLQQGSKTELTFQDMDFSVELQEEIFSTRWLER